MTELIRGLSMIVNCKTHNLCLLYMQKFKCFAITYLSMIRKGGMNRWIHKARKAIARNVKGMLIRPDMERKRQCRAGYSG